MGAGFSSANNVYIYLDRPGAAYHSGDVVNGYVLLNCVQPFDCRQILLELKGYEKVSWEEEYVEWQQQAGESHSNYRSTTTYHNGHQTTTTTTTSSHTPGASTRVVHKIPHTSRNQFFQVSIPVQTFPQYCMPGQYQLPFTFQLPMNLPGSFEYIGARNTCGSTTYNWTKAKIKYKLKAECVVPGIFTPNLRFKTYLTLQQRLAKMPTEIKSSSTQQVTKCCCSSQGHATMTAHVQKDSYMPGESAGVVLEVSNDSTAEFSKVVLTLRRRVKLMAERDPYYTRSCSYNSGNYQKVDATVAEQSYPGILANSQATGASARVLQLNLPSGLLPTTIGRLIENEYTLIVTLKAASAIVSDVKLKVPVLIYGALPEQPVFTQPPPWWSATVVGTPVQLPLPSTPPMPPPVQEMDESRAMPPQQAPPPQMQAPPQPQAPGPLPAYPNGAPQPQAPGPLPAYPNGAPPGMPAYPNQGAPMVMPGPYPYPQQAMPQPYGYAPQPGMPVYHQQPGLPVYQVQQGMAAQPAPPAKTA